MGTASAVGEEVAVAAVKARQLGLACCFACRAASVKTMAMAKAKARFAAPPGAGKGAVGSGSFFNFKSFLNCGQRSGPAGTCSHAHVDDNVIAAAWSSCPYRRYPYVCKIVLKCCDERLTQATQSNVSARMSY